ncbi:hypothetical protein ZMTM_07380 [Methyloradius palustris]|uniref:Uncharacterized protein n=1 Tax=Methyloradius palustris TaxID=2778876 RepID=A0A8D5JVV3_9PROT|nr:hypothetical protein ZMTM_07380 [Methyloradius palustris]
MTTLQISIRDYLIDYKCQTAFDAYKCQKKGLLVRGKILQDKADDISAALISYEMACNAEH